SVEQARARLGRALAEYWLDHRLSVEQAEREDKPRRVLPPMAVRVTTGVGKSTSAHAVLLEVQAAGFPALLVLPTRQLAMKAAEAIPGAVVWMPRKAAKNEEDIKNPAGADPFSCYQLGHVSKAGTQNHRPAQSLCRQCPHGHAGAMKHGGAEAVEQAVQWFKSLDIDSGAYAPCAYLYRGLPAQLRAQILIVTREAFSDAVIELVEMDSAGRIRRTPRLVIVDESIQPASEISIHAGDVEQWRERLPVIAERFERAAQKQADPVEAESLHSKSDFLKNHVDQFCTMLLHSLADRQLPDAEQVRAFAKAASAQKSMSAAGAYWERVQWLNEDEYLTPLRALSALAWSMKVGAARATRSGLNVYEISPIIQHATKRGSTIFLDATLPADLAAIIQAVGGKVIQATAAQNMVVTHYVGEMYGRGNPKKKSYGRDADRKRREAERIAAYIMSRSQGRPVALLLHRAWLAYTTNSDLGCETLKTDPAAVVATFKQDTGCQAGWFGMHDRGHDAWSGHDLAIIGVPLPSPDAYSSAYAASRAAVLSVKPELDSQFPKFSGDLDETSFPPLPQQKEVREWLLDSLAQNLVQGIGRARAVNHRGEPLQVSLWGGIQGDEMRQAILRQGVQIDQIKQNPIHISRGTSSRAVKRDALALVRDAASACKTAGVRVSRPNIEKYLRAAGCGLRASDIAAGLAELRSAGEIKPESSGGRPRTPAASCQIEEEEEMSVGKPVPISI
ncbi:MAG: hypothetical protein U7M05_11420, partial [Candidatus Igneacidithiobacillus chanchocoensis]